MGLVVLTFAPLAAPIGVSVIVILDLLVVYRNIRIDPFYAAFAYFAPPRGEFHKKWYSPGFHSVMLSIVGIPFFLEGLRTFAFNLVNNIIGPYCAIKCLQLVQQSIDKAPMQMTIAQKIENGIKLYDTFSISMKLGQDIQAFDHLMILGLGYVILMFNAAATVMAWDILPVEMVWIPPLLTFFCVFILFMVLPVCLECFNGSKGMLRKWTNLARHTRNTRCVRKQLASRLPVGYIFGDFRKMNNEFRLAYLDSITDRTSNQILVYQSGGAFSI